MSHKPPYQLSKEDQALWQVFVQEFIEHDEPSPLEEECFSSLLEAQEAKGLEKKELVSPITLTPQQAKIPYQKREYDPRTKQSLGKGHVHIEASLDLHGLNRDQSERAVYRFIRKAYQEQKRIVLIVTGKGRFSPSGVSVLRQELPRWLKGDELSDIVLFYKIAKPKDGGDGAFYILLKKKT